MQRNELDDTFKRPRDPVWEGDGGHGYISGEGGASESSECVLRLKDIVKCSYNVCKMNVILECCIPVIAV